MAKQINIISERIDDIVLLLHVLMQMGLPVFASKRAEQDFYDRIWLSRIRSLTC